MVVTRSSKEEQSVKDESQATEGGAEEGGAVGGQEEVKETIDQSEMLNVLLKTVEKMSKTLVNHAEQGAQLTAQMAKMSTVFGQQSSGSGDVSIGAAELSASHGESPQGDQVSTLPQASKHFAKPQVYDCSISWLAFRTQFDSISSIHGWNDQEKLGELVACLRGPALEAFAHFPVDERNNYTQLMGMLEQRFGCGKQEPWFRAQFRRRMRGPGEPLSTLARDIEKLAFQAYPDASQELRDSLACDQFLDALGDADLQIMVRQSRPSCLQDAVTGAVEVEAIRRSVKAVHGEPHLSSGFSARQADTRVASASERNSTSIEQRLNALEASLRSVRNRRRNPPPRTSRLGSSEGVECWSCGKRGHIRRDCPKTRTPQSAGTSQHLGNEE